MVVAGAGDGRTRRHGKRGAIGQRRRTRAINTTAAGTTTTIVIIRENNVTYFNAIPRKTVGSGRL